MLLFDANMILRYLLNDNTEMAEIAEEHLLNREVAVTVEVIAEVVYVLKRVYKLDNSTIANSIKEFISIVKSNEKDLLSFALDAYKNENLDFVDCILYAYNKKRGYEIATFDKKLLQLLQ